MNIENYPPLKALKNIKREAGIPYFSTLYDIDMWREDFEIVETALQRLYIQEKLFNLSPVYSEIEKKLKALEIIKKKQVDIKWCGDLPPLLQQTYAISQEEYDLLKEVLL